MKTSPISLLLILSLAVSTTLAPLATAQNCSTGLNDLMVCAPFVDPSSGATAQNPSSACCNALKGVNRDCLCNTLDIISKLPTTCSLPPLQCSA